MTKNGPGEVMTELHRASDYMLLFKMHDAVACMAYLLRRRFISASRPYSQEYRKSQPLI